jgi:chloramphenicol 3-O-phosphotransferase
VIIDTNRARVPGFRRQARARRPGWRQIRLRLCHYPIVSPVRLDTSGSRPDDRPAGQLKHKLPGG